MPPVQLGCVSHDSPQRKSILREWKIGIESHSQVLQGHDASRKNYGMKGSIARSRAKM